MILIDFPYTTTNRLVKYSKLVTKATASFNRNYAPTVGTITHDPYYGLPLNEDRLEYWDNSNEDITFGRYLLFTKKKENKENNKEEIPFWTGFNLKRTKIIYCIWFEKKYLSQLYIQKLEELEKHRQQEPSNGKEIWIPMKDTELNDFCNSCAYRRRHTLKDFWNSVLKELK